MMKEEFKPFDAAEYLETVEDMAGYLDACLDEDTGDGMLVRLALKDIARAYGMTQIARDTGLPRKSVQGIRQRRQPRIRHHHESHQSPWPETPRLHRLNPD